MPKVQYLDDEFQRLFAGLKPDEIGSTTVQYRHLKITLRKGFSAPLTSSSTVDFGVTKDWLVYHAGAGKDVLRELSELCDNWLKNVTMRGQVITRVSKNLWLEGTRKRVHYLVKMASNSKAASFELVIEAVE